MKRLLIVALFASSAFVSGGVASGHPCYWEPNEPFHLPLQPPCDLFGGGTAADCGFNTLAQETLTGGQDTFTGMAYGYVISGSPGASVSVRCSIRVDGSEAASSSTGTGTQFATTAGQVTYTATDTQDVDLCTVYTVNGGSETAVCGETTTTQIPPQEVIDLLDQIFQIIADETAALDPIICGVLQAAGAPGLLNGTTSLTTISMDADDCDLYIGGDRWIDFVPYQD